MASYRDRLVATLRAIEPVLASPDVLIAGPQLPNPLERGAASTLVVFNWSVTGYAPHATINNAAAIDELETVGSY
jgi:hypothetical protein